MAPSIDQLRTSAPTLDVPVACRLLGISRSHGYAAIRRGQFPAKVLKVGGAYRVITASLLEALTGETAAT